jgi:hypothetical protein
MKSKEQMYVRRASECRDLAEHRTGVLRRILLDLSEAWDGLAAREAQRQAAPAVAVAEEAQPIAASTGAAPETILDSSLV